MLTINTPTPAQSKSVSQPDAALHKKGLTDK
jgi:hypothetical protein